MNIEQVRKLDVKTAASDAKAALARGDKRLLAVYGFTLSVPGGPQQGDAHIWRDTTGLRILDGTSDAIHGEAGRRFNDNARAYAEKYNKVMLSEH
ncbi:MAG: hypothetical protein ABI450_10490 [Rhizomicrobium sp.]